jgi:Cu/Ag efflux protein CusF
VYEDSVTAYATVRGVDPATRKVTLETADGNRATFTAPPEVRNLDQLRSGDRVKATFTERLTVLVNQDATPGGDYATASARTPKGAKPGAIVAESYEAVASVKSIDTAKRTATLEFADGKTIPVPVREDVDLTRYKAGDHVLIRVTDVLSVLTSSP